MTTTTVTLADCATCHGTTELPNEKAGQDRQCGYCNGFGVKKRTGYGPYKTAATAATALARGTGSKCYSCNGVGSTVEPDTTHCYDCHDGKVVVSAMPGDAWGDAPNRVKYSHMTGAAQDAYRDAVEYRVTIANRVGTWNEAHLGLGSVASCTDYGRRWDECTAPGEHNLTRRAQGIAALVDDVRTTLSTQWIQLTTADDTIADTLVIELHRHGYTVKAANARTPNFILPPTYTAELLNAPVGTI
jgi:hypothetical protein